MKNLLLFFTCALFAITTFAQGINDNGDNIVGDYYTEYGGSKNKIRVTKNNSGSYKAQVFWVEKDYDKEGNKIKDKKNPDKSLRNIDIDKVVLVDGLVYDKENKSWGGTKIYDPSKGIKVAVSAQFVTNDKLKLRGTILGIGATLYWERIK